MTEFSIALLINLSSLQWVKRRRTRKRKRSEVGEVGLVLVLEKDQEKDLVKGKAIPVVLKSVGTRREVAHALERKEQDQNQSQEKEKREEVMKSERNQSQNHQS